MASKLRRTPLFGYDGNLGIPLTAAAAAQQPQQPPQKHAAAAANGPAANASSGYRQHQVRELLLLT